MPAPPPETVPVHREVSLPEPQVGVGEVLVESELGVIGGRLDEEPEGEDPESEVALPGQLSQTRFRAERAQRSDWETANEPPGAVDQPELEDFCRVFEARLAALDRPQPRVDQRPGPEPVEEEEP